MDKLHKQIVKGLGHNDVSPAAMAYKLVGESRYVNESMLQYFVNYVVIMATKNVVPFQLAEVQQQCKMIYSSLQELGLTGTVGREPVSNTEYLLV